MRECEPWLTLDVYPEGDEERIDAGPRWKGHCNGHINAQRGRVKRIKNQESRSGLMEFISPVGGCPGT